jgi:SAM-dependent MidA family methyltransferase
MTVAAFMELALYDPELGYYARAPRRSGRAGDFFTSVDVGPLFGELLEIQLAEMFDILQSTVDFVEAGASDGRLSADILRAARRRGRAFYDRVHLHLVEESAVARAVQRETLGEVADRLVSSSATLPDSFEGVLLANELLDALPVHQVVMRREGLREVYVTARLATDDSRLTTVEGPPSTPALAMHLARLGATLLPGWRAEISLRAVEWVRDAARRLRRGFVVLVDYGHEAQQLYSAAHSAGTLTSFAKHTMAGAERATAEPRRGSVTGGRRLTTDDWRLTTDTPAWLSTPGQRDLTAHVDFTSVRTAAEDEGLTTLGFLDQTYFLLGLLGDPRPAANVEQDLHRRLALKTLVMPGGLGSTHKVLILGKGVGRPSLRGCSFRMRVT